MFKYYYTENEDVVNATNYIDSDLVNKTEENFYILPNDRVYRDDFTFISDKGIGGLRGFDYVYYKINGDMDSDTLIIYFPDLELNY